MPKTPSKTKQPVAITNSFPKDTAEETVLVETSGLLSEAVTACLKLSNDGRLSPSAQASLWNLGQSLLLTVGRIETQWYEILAKFDLAKLRLYRDIAKTASAASLKAQKTPSTETVWTAYEALGSANDAFIGMLDSASTSA